MICPLLAQGSVYKDDPQFEGTDCLLGGCAWWDENGGICAVLSLTEAVRTLAKNTLIASGHLPPEDQ